ncbi:MAG: NYN domain-containing protein [Defluviitaleaceae bacterium]|nr:NYN domain-containing protein [Defluviitaleaceae bacterium]
MLCNTAIFYDIENLTAIFGGKSNTVLHLDEIYRRVLELEGIHGVSVQRAYADWAMPQHRNFRNSVLQVGIEPVQIFNTNQHDKIKNAADVSLIIDAVDLISRRPEIENYVIASGDGIFAFLAKKLHEHGKRVIGCGFGNITNVIFQNSCDYYIELEKSDAAIIATSSVRKTKASASSPAPSAQPQAHVQAPVEAIEQPEVPPQKKIPANFPKTKYTEALIAADIPIWRNKGDLAGCFHTVRKMVEAIFDSETKDLPGLEVSVFTNYLGHYLPDFKVTRHGFKRVSEFIRFALTSGPFCIHSIEDNVLLIAPRELARGNVMEDVKGLVITSAEGNKYNSVFNVPLGEPFVYSLLPDETTKTVAPKPPASKQSKARRTTKTAPAQAPTIEPTPAIPPVAGSIRKWIKDRFEELSAADILPPGEVRKLTTAEHSEKTFGVRTPIFKEIETRSNLTEQRTANGKIKYWKESFRFNGKMYLVYKEWVANLHEKRFSAWIDTFPRPKSLMRPETSSNYNYSSVDASRISDTEKYVSYKA